MLARLLLRLDPSHPHRNKTAKHRHPPLTLLYNSAAVTTNPYFWWPIESTAAVVGDIDVLAALRCAALLVAQPVLLRRQKTEGCKKSGPDDEKAKRLRCISVLPHLISASDPAPSDPFFSLGIPLRLSPAEIVCRYCRGEKDLILALRKP